MFADIGNLALLVGLGASAFAFFAYLIGGKNKDSAWLGTANSASLVIVGLTTIASAALTYLLLSSDFSISYVFQHTSSDLSPIYKFSAFWAGQEGSLLLWLWLHTIFATLVANSVSSEDENLRPYASAVMAAISFIFFIIVALLANPFTRMPYAASDGAGLNPLLQNPGMIIHPVALYIGYVGLAVPYAYAMAALLKRDNKSSWLKAARPWTLFAWMFLSIGMIYGGQWAYVELGWGGYWAWDPVENASLFPWLVATAFFHSAIMHERKGVLKGWAQWLVIFSYALCVFGTFLTRSGILQSVHAFPSNPLMTATFLTLIVLTIGVGAYLVLSRREQLRGAAEIEDFSSKEGTFLLGNMILSFAAFAVVLGTMMPVITKLFTSKQIAMDARFFNTFSVPMGILLLILIGFCTRIAWKKSEEESWQWLGTTAGVAVGFGIALYIMGVHSLVAIPALMACLFVVENIFAQVWTEVRGFLAREKGTDSQGSIWGFFAANRRRYGAYIVHLSIVMMMVGFTGNIWNETVERQMTAGGPALQVAGYSVQFNGLREVQIGKVSSVVAELPVTKNGKAFGILRPAVNFYPDYTNSGEESKPSTEIAVKGTPVSDFYVILSSWGPNGQEATFKVMINYLVQWVWTGMWVLVIGTLIAVWPKRAASVVAQTGSESTRKSSVSRG